MCNVVNLVTISNLLIKLTKLDVTDPINEGKLARNLNVSTLYSNGELI